jgi:predicted ATPase
MRAVFDHSWHLLTEREQQVLGALSVLGGTFDESAARHVAGASLRDLRSLADKSMLYTTVPCRYHLHDLLRQYAEEKLEAVPGAAEAARDRHAALFATAWAEGQALATDASPGALEQIIACAPEA